MRLYDLRPALFASVVASAPGALRTSGRWLTKREIGRPIVRRQFAIPVRGVAARRRGRTPPRLIATCGSRTGHESTGLSQIERKPWMALPNHDVAIENRSIFKSIYENTIVAIFDINFCLRWASKYHNKRLTGRHRKVFCPWFDPQHNWTRRIVSYPESNLKRV